MLVCDFLYFSYLFFFVNRSVDTHQLCVTISFQINKIWFWAFIKFVCCDQIKIWTCRFFNFSSFYGVNKKSIHRNRSFGKAAKNICPRARRKCALMILAVLKQSSFPNFHICQSLNFQGTFSELEDFNRICCVLISIFSSQTNNNLLDDAVIHNMFLLNTSGALTFFT